MFAGFGFILGAVLGSFVKVLADRSIRNKSFWGRSYCPACKHKLAWYDLFPIVSYFTLGGKCRYCKDKIGIEYLVIEVVMGFLIGFLFWDKFSLDLPFKTFFISTLAVLFITDLKKMFIPDRITFPAIAITFIYIASISLYNYFQRHALITAYPLFGSILMAVLIGGFFMLLIIVTRGKGMGGGDVKLGALIGLALGFPNALIALMVSFISGAVLSLGLILLKRKHFGQSIPFGPFLVFGSLVALFWGNQILEWYLKF